MQTRTKINKNKHTHTLTVIKTLLVYLLNFKIPNQTLVTYLGISDAKKKNNVRTIWVISKRQERKSRLTASVFVGMSINTLLSHTDAGEEVAEALIV